MNKTILSGFIAEAQVADRANVAGTLGEIRKDFDKVEIGKSTTNQGMYYVVLSKGNQRLVATFSKALSEAFGKGEVTAAHLDSMEIALQKNAGGDERVKLQFPAGSKRADITAVKQVEFKRTFTLEGIDLSDLVA